MEIEKLLKISKHVDNDKEVIGMILSNRIDYYCGDDVGAAVTARQFHQLTDDILAWHKSKIEP